MGGINVDGTAVGHIRQTLADRFHRAAIQRHAVNADEQHTLAAHIQPCGAGLTEIQHTADLHTVLIAGNIKRPAAVLRQQNLAAAKAEMPSLA